MRPARRLLAHPCVGVPPRAQQALAVAARLALAELGHDTGQAAIDLRAVALVLRHLLTHYTVHREDEHRAADAALQALDEHRQGVGRLDTARAACGLAVEVFEAMLGAATWRRLQLAQIEADRSLREQLGC